MKTTDRELLELAAKAAGIDWQSYHLGRGLCLATPKGGMVITQMWNPLSNDGDALRLAVTLGLVIDCSRPSAGEPFKGHAVCLDELMSNEELTRRSIVMAAAEIGKKMK